MSIAVIDADLIGRKKHRFPNLVCMKISAYYKDESIHGTKKDVVLKLDYNNLDEFEEVFIAKVFTDTPFPADICDTEHIHLGGTGFYFDKAPKLPDYIEHHMPDYHLYDEWIENEVYKAKIKNVKEGCHFNEKSYRLQFKCYTDYSIGFLTRGCFRKCKFCVNQKYDQVFHHASLDEFYDPSRKKICLLDDNVLGCQEFPKLIEELRSKAKPFVFKQGIDIRLLNDERAKLLFESRYDGNYIFAFDNLSDYDLIQEKLGIIQKYKKGKYSRFYVLVGFESIDYKDIESAFIRIKLLLEYGCLPYIMRYQSKNEVPWKNSKYRSLYVTIASWCNQVNIIKKMTFEEFCIGKQKVHKTAGTYGSTMRSMIEFKEEHPEIAEKYFNIKYVKQ